MAIFAKANLLVLGELTNHLDIQSRKAVEEALSEFNATTVTVSHDRYFLDAAVNRTAEIRDRRFVLYTGTFSEFWFEPAAGSRLKDADLSRRAVGGRTTGGELTAAGIEAEILRLEAEQRRLEHSLAADFAKRAQSDGRKDPAALRKIRAHIDELSSRWADL